MLHATLHESTVFLDASGRDLVSVVEESLARLVESGVLAPAEWEAIEADFHHVFPAPDDLGLGVGVLRLPHGGAPHCSLVRLPVDLTANDGATLRFLWIVTGPDGANDPSDEELEPFGWMLQDVNFSARALNTQDPAEFLALYEEYLHRVETPPASPRLPPEMRRTGRLGGALLLDIRRWSRRWVGDWRDGLHPKSMAATLFLYFACLAPAVAFGGLLSTFTNGDMGVIETILATAICGMVYAVFSGQPLTILGSTGPITIFLGILYGLCQTVGVPFLPTLAWTGLWTALLLTLMVVFELGSLVRHFTRFTDETFAALIALIYVVEALKNALKGFGPDGMEHDSAPLSVLLAGGTFLVATGLSSMRRSQYTRRVVREFLADFGPAIAIVSMTLFAVWMRPSELETLTVPSTFVPTSGRPWLVDLFEAPLWVRFASLGPALLAALLLYLDQNITVRLVNSPQYKLKKGAGYHLDMLVIAALVAFCSLFGLPWFVAATVRSLNHNRALATVEVHGAEEVITGVRENRVTGFAIHALVGASLLLLGLLSMVPMSVLFGLFLFMGIASMRGNQFFDRMRLLVTDPSMYPPTHYLRRVPTQMVHLYTAIQAAALGALWLVKSSTVSILFPLLIGMLPAIRLAMRGFFRPEHLAFLDATEVPEDEEYRDLD